MMTWLSSVGWIAGAVVASSLRSDAVDQTPSSVHGSVTEDPMPKDILRDELIGKDYRNIKPSDFNQNVLSKQAVESVFFCAFSSALTLSTACFDNTFWLKSEFSPPM